MRLVLGSFRTHDINFWTERVTEGNLSRGYWSAALTFYGALMVSDFYTGTGLRPHPHDLEETMVPRGAPTPFSELDNLLENQRRRGTTVRERLLPPT